MTMAPDMWEWGGPEAETLRPRRRSNSRDEETGEDNDGGACRVIVKDTRRFHIAQHCLSLFLMGSHSSPRRSACTVCVYDIVRTSAFFLCRHDPRIVWSMGHNPGPVVELRNVELSQRDVPLVEHSVSAGCKFMHVHSPPFFVRMSRTDA